MTMQRSTPRVSILLPFYQAQAFLAEAIDSVISQTFSDWELLLLDDGSSDASRNIAHAYAARDPQRISVWEHEGRRNLGLPATRNFGLRRARGELIALLDADDIWQAHKLTQQVELLDRYPAASMVYGRSAYWKPQAGDRAHSSWIPPIAPQGLYEAPALLRMNYPLGTGGSPCPSDLLFYREAALEIGGFAEDFSAWEDIVFLSKMFTRHRVLVSSECWDWYRVHPLSMSAQARRSGADARARTAYFRWLGTHLRRHAITDVLVWKQFGARTRELRYPWLRTAARMLKGALRA